MSPLTYKNPIHLLIFNILLIVIIQVVVRSEQISQTASYAYVFLAMLLMTMSLRFSLNTETKYDPPIIGACISVMLVFFVILYQFDNMGSSVGEQMGAYLTYGVGGIILLVGLAIVYKGIVNAIGNLTGIPGFILNLIFFIPCMITDFVNYIKSEFNLTPPVVYILLAIETFLILLYVGISQIPKITMNLGGISILNEALFLDSKYTFKNVVRIPDKIFPEVKGANRYAISLWTFVNQRTHLSDRNTNIFAYGSEGSWKPQIKFKGAVKSYSGYRKDTYVVIFAPGVETEIDLPSQMWHNFVFNYNGDYVDLFVNGSLERSFTGIPDYNETTDQFITGDDSGIYGAICNVTYYNDPLNLREITSAYNLLKGTNPPIK